MAQKFSMGFLGGWFLVPSPLPTFEDNKNKSSNSSNFWSRDFLGVLIFPSFDHPHHLKSRVPPGQDL